VKNEATADRVEPELHHHHHHHHHHHQCRVLSEERCAEA